MATALKSKSAIVDRLFEVFRRGGFDGTAMSDISEATGLGKSSLYHHFPGGKDEMASAIFARAASWFEANLAAALSAGTREERIDGMLKAVDAFYAGGKKPCIIASMSVGASRKRHQRQLRSAVEAWTGALARALRETGAPAAAARDAALDAVIRIEGALVVSAALDDAEPFRKTLRALRSDLIVGRG